MSCASCDRTTSLAVDSLGGGRMYPVLIVARRVAAMVVERCAPGVWLPVVRGWWVRAIAINLAQVLVVYLRVGRPGIAGSRTWPVDADGLGTVPGGALGYVAITFVYYWWHRARHEMPLLWRWFHQVHHSPQRIEIITSFYKHPLEILRQRRALERDRSTVLVGLGLQRGHRWRCCSPAWPSSSITGTCDAALARLPDPAAGEPLRAPPGGAARVQLRRPAAVGHAVRHVPQPA